MHCSHVFRHGTHHSAPGCQSPSCRSFQHWSGLRRPSSTPVSARHTYTGTAYLTQRVACSFLHESPSLSQHCHGLWGIWFMLAVRLTKGAAPRLPRRLGRMRNPHIVLVGCSHHCRTGPHRHGTCRQLAALQQRPLRRDSTQFVISCLMQHGVSDARSGAVAQVGRWQVELLALFPACLAQQCCSLQASLSGTAPTRVWTAAVCGRVIMTDHKRSVMLLMFRQVWSWCVLAPQSIAPTQWQPHHWIAALDCRRPNGRLLLFVRQAVAEHSSIFSKDEVASRYVNTNGGSVAASSCRSNAAAMSSPHVPC